MTIKTKEHRVYSTTALQHEHKQQTHIQNQWRENPFSENPYSKLRTFFKLIGKNTTRKTVQNWINAVENSWMVESCSIFAPRYRTVKIARRSSLVGRWTTVVPRNHPTKRWSVKRTNVTKINWVARLRTGYVRWFGGGGGSAMLLRLNVGRTRTKVKSRGERNWVSRNAATAQGLMDVGVFFALNLGFTVKRNPL